MSTLSEQLKDLHIGQSNLNGVYTWIRLTDEDIDKIKAVFYRNDYTKDGDTPTEKGQPFYDAFERQLKDYVGTAVDTNQFDSLVFDEILRRARVAAGLENE